MVPMTLLCLGCLLAPDLSSPSDLVVRVAPGSGGPTWVALLSRVKLLLPQARFLPAAATPSSSNRPSARSKEVWLIQGGAGWKGRTPSIRARSLLLLSPGEAAPKDASFLRIPGARDRLWKALGRYLPKIAWVTLAAPGADNRPEEILVLRRAGGRDPVRLLAAARHQVQGVVLEDGALSPGEAQRVLGWCQRQGLAVASDAPWLVRREVALAVVPDLDRLALSLARALLMVGRGERFQGPELPTLLSLEVAGLRRAGARLNSITLARADRLRGQLGRDR